MIETITIRHCDQDPTHAKRDAETITFGVDGRQYETELCVKDRSAFDKMIAPYLAVARKVTNVAIATKAPRRTQAMRNRAAAIRKWGIETGRIPDDESGKRGRIPVQVIHEYDELRAEPTK